MHKNTIDSKLRKVFNKFNMSGEMWYWRPEAEGSDRVLIVVTTCMCGNQQSSSHTDHLYDRVG